MLTASANEPNTTKLDYDILSRAAATSGGRTEKAKFCPFLAFSSEIKWEAGSQEKQLVLLNWSDFLSNIPVLICRAIIYSK